MIPIYAADASGNKVLILDEQGTDTDQGSAFTAKMRSAPFDLGPATGFATLRRLVQAVTIEGPATIKVTPVGDGNPYPDQAVSVALQPAQGLNRQIEVPTYVQGTRFQQDVEVPLHQGRTQLGEADQWWVPRRTVRGSSS